MGGYMHLDGATGEYASTPDTAALSITGDIDVRWYGAMDDWTPSGNQVLIGKDGATDRAWYLRVNATTGMLEFGNSTDGSALAAEASSVAPTVSNGEVLWVRVTLDVDDGASDANVTFYTGGSAATPVWVQLGAVQAKGATTSIFDSARVVEVGTRALGTAARLAGDVYRTQIYSGIGGTLVFDADFTDLTDVEITAEAFTESSSNAATVTLNGTAWTYVRNVAIPPDNLKGIGAMLGSDLDTELLGYLVEVGSLGDTDTVGALNSINSTDDIGFVEAYTTWLATYATTGPGA